MERIRLGNNIAISWALYDLNGRVHSLEDKEVQLYVSCGGLKQAVTDYTIQGNVVSWVFLGTEQKKVGLYKLILVETDALSGAQVVDVAEAFRLVSETLSAVETGEVTKNVSVRSVLTYSNLVGVESVDVVESSEDDGINLVSIRLVDGNVVEIPIKNGSKGDTGATGATGATGPKGDKGDIGERGPAGIDSVEASIGTNDPTQAPSVDKELAEGVLSLTFNNIKGQKGDKGDQGNTGSSVDYPYELVNNVTTDDATKGLSAAQGVVLDGKIGQLGQRAISFKDFSKNIHNSRSAIVSVDNPDVDVDWYSHSVNAQGGFVANAGVYNITYYIPIIAGETYKSSVGLRRIAFYDNNKLYIDNSYRDYVSANTEIVAPVGSAYIILQYGIEYSPDDVKFGLYADDINVPYSVSDYDSKGRKVIVDDSIEYRRLKADISQMGQAIEEGTIKYIHSANIHNSAAAVSSDSQPSGPDWQNHGVNGQGEFLNSENYNISYYIPVDAGSSYKSNVPLRHVIFFNISKEVIPNSYVGDTISANTEIVAPAGSAYIILQYGIEYSPDDVKFGLYADDINVDYVDYIPSDSKGEMLITNRTPEYISLLNQKKLNVLLIGSSFGVNTIVQFPALANAGGVNCVCGNLYRGSCSLADVVAIINGTQSFSSGRVYTREHKWASATSNLNEMLALYEWDIIILQRSAPGGDGGSDKWNASMANDLNTIIQYIQAHTTNSPQIMFNSVFGRPIGSLGSRKSELASVDKIMSTAKEMQNEFGIEIIPAATAIQNARNTSLAYVETYNTAGYLYPEMTGSGDHLDTGVGSYVLACLLYEQLLGKRFDLSILNNTFLPTLEDVTNNGCFSDNDFTQITAAQAAIARYAAMCAVRDPMRISNVYSPKITENEGYLINRDGMVRPSTGFAYSSKFYAYAGQKIVVNARGYETNVAILAKVNLEGVDYLPVAVSTDSTYKGYEYAVIESGYYAASFSTSYPRNIIIESDERNDVEKPLLIERVENNVTISSGNNSIRFVLEKNASNKYAGNPVFNFSQYTFNGVTNQNTDDIAPMHALNTTIGANHGQPCVIATINNHGLDNTAIGTGWTKGGVTFYVMRIVDANKVVMMSENRGTMTAPLFVDLTPGDIIRGGATLTVSSTEASQLYPIVKNHSYKMCIDGNEYIYGIKKGDSFEVVESYDIMNPASVLQQIIARAGQSTEPEYNGDVAVRVENTYHFTQNLTVVVITTIIPKQEFAFSDAMFSQAVRIGNNGVVKYYVPNSLPVGGGAYDMRKPLAMTWGDNIPSIFVGRSQMKDPDNHPVNRVMQYDSSIGFALGFLTDRGVGQSLLEFTNNVFELRNNTGKVYPHGVDNKVGPTLLPGNIYSAVMYRALFVPQNSGNRMSMYHFRFDNAEYVYVDYSGSMVDRVEVDDSLNGKKISVIESVNAELKTDVYNSGFYVNATFVNNDTCYLVVKIA